jgi:X-Pro dipeptidyl-peptidase
VQGRRLALAAAIALVWPAAAAADPPSIVVSEGVTQQAFGYTDAIRQRVFIPSSFDSDNDGANDVIAVDIMRPAASDQGMKVPVIMDASPYYSTLGRGNEGQLKQDDANGLLAKWPLFLDNYFVPRGYAVALVDMTGTNHSTGCPTVQGDTDNQAAVMAIDWLNGRRAGFDQDGRPVSAASWHSGKTGMIGKSYDGSLAAAAATTGVAGLTTIVPESGPYQYYDYTRSNGVIQRGNHYLASLASTVTNPDRRDHCAPVRQSLNDNDGDATANYSPFWEPRNYVKDAFKVRASVLATHGLEDENVRIDHFSKFWYALSDLGVPRHARLMQVGHVDPFDVNRADWVKELHRWFDYWLWDVPNGVMSEPAVEVETSPGTFTKYASWPVPGTAQTQVFLQPGPDAGTLGLAPAGGAEPTTTFTDSANQTETAMLANPTTVTNNRRVFLSPPLTAPVHLSGTPVVQLDGQVNNKTGAHLGAALVDFGPAFPRVTDDINNNGVETLSTSDCWVESSPADSACYLDVGERINTASIAWRVSKGVLDAGHKDSLTDPAPITAGRRYPFGFPLLPEDYTFPAGHRIGVVIVGSYRSYGTSADPAPAAQITLSLRKSRITLPVVGGGTTLRAAGLAAGAATTTSVALTDTRVTATVTANDPAMRPAALPGFAREALPAADFTGFTALNTPTGAVQFKAGDANLGAPVPLVHGVATLTTAAGSGPITAAYRGDGGFDPSTTTAASGSVSGSVPATLSLTLGTPATFGAFTPGVAHDYTATTTADVISTAGDATLSVADPSATATGHLVNGAFSLPAPLRVGNATLPATVKTYAAPVSHDTAAIEFEQAIGAGDALRTGTYAKTLTFTLSTASP